MGAGRHGPPPASRRGDAGALVACSGSGWHLLLPVQLPNNEASKALCKGLLHALADRCNNEQARIDTTTYNASRICRLYGTCTRKGEPTADRPHRQSWLVGLAAGEAISRPTPEQCGQQIAGLLARWKRAEEIRKGRPAGRGDMKAYGKKALQSELGNLAGAAVGDRNNQLNNSSLRLGELVAAGLLDQEAAEEGLIATATDMGLEASEIVSTIRSGMAKGLTQPRQPAERNGTHRPAPRAANAAPAIAAEHAVPVYDPADICTYHDLVRAGAEISWLWEGWIQRGILNVIGAEPGTGKTRFTADLIRRVAHGIPWPDGQIMAVSKSERSLWVLADNHHDEIVSLCRAFHIEESILVNATRSEPYGGVLLETIDDLMELEGRIKAAKPLFVVIDTVGNSTDRNLAKSEDAKAYYQPLQVIARRNQVAILCLTHLNAAGGLLGRRVLEKVRCAMRIEKPDPGQPNRRRLEVVKSNSKTPQALGVTMGDAGNEYDGQPPERAPDGRFGGGEPVRLNEMKAWLTDRLQTRSAARFRTVERGRKGRIRQKTSLSW